MIVDGLRYADDAGDTVTFNHHTFVEIVVGIMVRWAGIAEHHARDVVNRSHLLTAMCTSHLQVVFLSHETEFHWAMLMAHGEQYWLRGISSEPPPDYEKWERGFIAQHGLAAVSFEFPDPLLEGRAINAGRR